MKTNVNRFLPVSTLVCFHIVGTCLRATDVATPSRCFDANFNRGSGVASQDVPDFLNAWCPSDPIADFNGNNQLDAADIFDLTNSWFAGCS